MEGGHVKFSNGMKLGMFIIAPIACCTMVLAQSRIAAPTATSVVDDHSMLLVERLLGKPHKRVVGQAVTTTNVTIMITGLVTVADASGGGSPVPKSVYLQDATKPGGRLMPHAAIVMADNLFLPTSVSGTGRTFTVEGNASYIRLGNGEELTFDPVSASPLKYSDAAPANICPTTAEVKAGSLYFLPKLSNVARRADGSRPGIGDLDPAFVTPQPGGPIAAFTKVGYGELVSQVLNLAVWEFKEDLFATDFTHIQVLADSVLWKFTISGPTLTLKSNNTPIATFTADALGDIVLTIANAPDPDGISFLANTPVGVEVRKQTVDDHFQLYYKYLNPKNLTTYKPVAFAVCEAGVLKTDQCALSHYLQIPSPQGCPLPPVLVGGLNCGPDGAP
jgi:hypothetical protein